MQPFLPSTRVGVQFPLALETNPGWWEYCLVPTDFIYSHLPHKGPKEQRSGHLDVDFEEGGH